LGGDPLLLIAHRGASGYRPEHTLGAYQLAVEMGADYIEPDVVATKDGVLVVRHENEISTTTNVEEHPEFAERRTSKVIDGLTVEGWFTEDFTLAELKTLRATERLPELRPQSAEYDGQYDVLTLQEVLDLVKSLEKDYDRRIGIYPETKHPTYFDSIGLSLEEPLVQMLHANGYQGEEGRAYIQSFEVANLKELQGLTQLPLMQLVNAEGAPYDFAAVGDPRTYRDMLTPEGLAEIATYADAIGPYKDLIVPRGTEDNLLAPTALIEVAHQAGLAVHAWTFRAENVFLPSDFRSSASPIERGDLAAEIRMFADLGVDGIFTDHPDIAAEARDDG
jgi:glycerophosphoryl diester phosphodiesterase